MGSAREPSGKVNRHLTFPWHDIGVGPVRFACAGCNTCPARGQGEPGNCEMGPGWVGTAPAKGPARRPTSSHPPSDRKGQPVSRLLALSLAVILLAPVASRAEDAKPDAATAAPAPQAAATPAPAAPPAPKWWETIEIHGLVD